MQLMWQPEQLSALGCDAQSGNFAKLGHVVVLKGGTSAERPISLLSGQAVYQALVKLGVNVSLFDVQSLEGVMQAVETADIVFIALHGRWGEDGTVQGILDSLGKVYTGSGLAASALAMDKLRTKWLWQGAGIRTPRFLAVTPDQPFDADAFDIGFPVIVKPVHEGSSIGMRKADDMAQLRAAIEFAQTFDSTVLVEQWITGREFTCACLGDLSLPLIELKTHHDFYDYEAKYVGQDTQYLCPVDLATEKQQEIAQLVLQAFNAVGAEGWGRVDLLLDEDATPWLIEINTVPGMTDHSLVPMAAKQAGLSFEYLVLNLLKLALDKAQSSAAQSMDGAC